MVIAHAVPRGFGGPPKIRRYSSFLKHRFEEFLFQGHLELLVFRFASQVVVFQRIGFKIIELPVGVLSIGCEVHSIFEGSLVEATDGRRCPPGCNVIVREVDAFLDSRKGDFFLDCTSIVPEVTVGAPWCW